MSGIKVSSIEIQFLNQSRYPQHIGFASIVLNGAYRVNDIGIYRDGTGIRLNFPEKMLRNTQKIQIFSPLTAEARELITKAVKDAIDKQREQRQGE